MTSFRCELANSPGFVPRDIVGVDGNSLVRNVMNGGPLRAAERKSCACQASARFPMLVRWPGGLVSARRGPATHRQFDGESLLRCVARDGPGCRDSIGLEREVCYDKSNHGSALTDGRQHHQGPYPVLGRLHGNGKTHR